VLSSAAEEGALLQYVAQEHAWRGSYEVIPLPDGSDMGVVGLHYDIHPSEMLPSLYFGLGGYGGAVGEEGGFFTMGATLGNRLALLDRLDFDLGLHFGGGGGSSKTFTGGGMIVRGHGLLEYRVAGDHYLRLGVAHTAFPNTTVSNSADSHLVVGYRSRGFGWSPTIAGGSSSNRYLGGYERFRIFPSLMHYTTNDDAPVNRNGSYTDSGGRNADFQLLGMQLDHFFNDYAFGTLELYGAGGGGADGYASITTGLGLRIPLLAGINWESKGLVGLAGDGRIDTGGGLVSRAMTGLSFDLGDHWYLKTMVGRMVALDGELEANAIDVGIGWQAQRPVARSGSRAAFSASHYQQVHWRGALVHKSYLPRHWTRNNEGMSYDDQLHLVGVELSKPLSGWLNLRGSTQWAYAGNVGSYAEGLLGLELGPEWLQFGPLGLSAAYDIGVGGGGDMELDEGFVHQALLGVNIRIDRDLSLALQGGRMESLGGTFSGELLQLQLVWEQDSLFAR